MGQHRFYNRQKPANASTTHSLSPPLSKPLSAVRFSGLWDGCEWIPHLLKPKSLKILFIYGDEFGHALLSENEGGTPVVGAAAGEIFGSEAGPEGVVKLATVGRESEDLPAGMLAEGFAGIHGGGGGERFGQDGGISQQSVEFKKDELGDGDIFARLEGFEKGGGFGVVGLILIHGGKENVRVNRDHRLARPRVSCSSAAMSCKASSGTLMPPPRTLGSCHWPCGAPAGGNRLRKSSIPRRVISASESSRSAAKAFAR